MRIIAGSRKGIRLTAFKSNAIRPTSDQNKEVMFNVLAGFMCGSHVLDLYAGTGNLGIEALSRGAAKAIFIDNAFKSVKIISENLLKTNFVNKADVFKMSTSRAIKRFSASRTKFDIIFADPPYYKDLAASTLREVEKQQIIKDKGWLILEHEAKTANRLSPDNGRFFLKSQKKQGDTLVSFFQYDNQA